jgi:hypothetical protein
MDSIKFMLGLDKFDPMTFLSHPLWQVRVHDAIFRTRLAVRGFVGRVRQTVRMIARVRPWGIMPWREGLAFIRWTWR